MEPSFTELLASYIHMMLNRIMTDQPRMHELVIYDFLARYYKSMIARNATVYVQEIAELV
jgi:hypothetical protein